MSIQQHHFPTLSSTQSFLKENWPQLRSDNGLVLISTEKQTAGAGRQEATWEYFENSLAMSFSISAHRPHLGLTSLEIGCLVAKFFKDSSLYLKWPNDLFFQGQKCGGLIFQNLSENFFACGIGLNINPEDGAHRFLQNGQSISSIQLSHQTSLKELAHKLYEFILLNRMDAESIREEFMKRCIHLEKWCWLEQSGKVLGEGRFKGIGDQGQAMIQTAQGNIESHFSGSLYWSEN